MFTSIFALFSSISAFIPLAKFFFPLNTSENPPANPPAIPETPGTSETATPAITATTSSDIFIPSFSVVISLSNSTTSSLFSCCSLFSSLIFIPPNLFSK